MNPFQCSSTRRRVAVDLEPCQRVLERPAMHQRALGARRHLEVGEAATAATASAAAARCRRRAIGSMPIFEDRLLRRPPRTVGLRGRRRVPVPRRCRSAPSSVGVGVVQARRARPRRGARHQPERQSAAIPSSTGLVSVRRRRVELAADRRRARARRVPQRLVLRRRAESPA